MTDNPTSRDPARPGPPEPGTIDAGARHLFTGPAGTALAVVLHDATGWPLVHTTSPDATSRSWSVEHPDGYLVTIDGRTTPAGPVSRGTWQDAIDDYIAAGATVTLAEAATYVPAVLARIMTPGQCPDGT